MEEQSSSEQKSGQHRPMRLVDLAAYQEGAVVSRTLVKRDTGTVTFFSFAEGQALSEHTAPFDALAQAVEGEARVSIGGEVMNLRAGELVILPANVPHSLQATTPFKMLLVMVRS